MSLDPRTLLEEGLGRLRAFVRADEALARENALAREEFFGGPRPAPVGPEEEAGEARYGEWFLFERPSLRYREIPYLTFLRSAEDHLPLPLRDALERMAENVFGVFEVAALAPGEGMILTDLFRGRDLAVRDEEADLLIEVGDLLVGRLFPLGEEEFLLSSAVASFRSPELREALGLDLARARAASPAARLSQREIERLLWPAHVPAGPTEEAEAVVRGLLDEAGLPDLGYEALRRSLAEAPRPGPVIGPLLDRLAFETTVDLERARRALWALWHEARTGERKGEDAAPGGRPPAQTSAGKESARAAVEAFERGRARGEDLEGLLDQLERDLDLASEPDLDEPPDPTLERTAGNLMALVEEYLWERAREAPSRAAARSDAVRSFGRHLATVADPACDQLEQVGSDSFLGFARTRLLAATGPGSEGAALETLSDIEDFLRWGRDVQGIDALTRCEAALRDLRADLPRFFGSRAHLAAPSPGAPATSRFLVRLAPAQGSDELVLDAAAEPGAEPVLARIDPALAALVRERDLIEGELEPGGGAVRRLRVTGLVPATLQTGA